MRLRVVVTGVGCVTPLGTTGHRALAEICSHPKAVSDELRCSMQAVFRRTSLPEVRNWSIADVGEDASVWQDR